MKQLLFNIENITAANYAAIVKNPDSSMEWLNFGLEMFLQGVFDREVVFFRPKNCLPLLTLPRNYYVFCADVGVEAFLKELESWNTGIVDSVYDAIDKVNKATTNEERHEAAVNLTHMTAQQVNKPTAHSRYFILKDKKWSASVSSMLNEEILDEIKTNPNGWAILRID